MSMEDAAQQVECAEWEKRNLNRKPLPKFTPQCEGYGPAECSDEDCDNIMPVMRREMGASLCTECKSIEERLAARRR